MKSFDKPLVSFCIVTWNTSKYILETLECAKNQTYQNIELIVSDDCSSDNTVELVEKWIKENGDRFNRTEIITVSNNSGAAANRNRAEIAAKGEYLKLLDGDDLVDDTFIEKGVNAFLANPEYSFLYTNTYSYVENEDKSYEENTSAYKSGYLFKELFMVDFWIKTTGWMFKKEVATTTKFNEKMMISEDYLRTLHIAKEYKIFYLDEYLAYYRRHDGNIKKENNKWIKKGLFKYFESQMTAIDFFKDYELYNERRESILNYLVEEAKAYKLSYLLKMYMKYYRLSYLAIYIKELKQKVKGNIKKLTIFKLIRQSLFVRKLKGEK